jgi:acetylglutamate kinase
VISNIQLGTEPKPLQIAPIVIKLGGALLDNPAVNAPFFVALAQFIQHNQNVVLVHGGGKSVDRHLELLGFKSEKRDGIRITPAEQMQEIAGVLAGQMNARLVGLLQSRGVNAVGLTLADGATTTARKTEKFAFDAGRVGEITGGDASLIQTLLRNGCTPIFSSIGMDSEGELLNINADEAAAAIARLVSARQLVLLTDVAGVIDNAGNIISSLDRNSVDRLTQRGAITGGMIAKVRAALEASEQAGVATLVAGWNDANVLQTLSNAGNETFSGTLFLPLKQACNS